MNILQTEKVDLKVSPKYLASLMLAACLVAFSSAHAYDSYQLKVLFTPTQDDLDAEAKGRVMIYDSLKNEVVEEALNEQFERIERMMFIRTLYAQENGEYEAEEDNCD